MPTQRGVNHAQLAPGRGDPSRKPAVHSRKSSFWLLIFHHHQQSAGTVGHVPAWVSVSEATQRAHCPVPVGHRQRALKFEQSVDYFRRPLYVTVAIPWNSRARVLHSVIQSCHTHRSLFRYIEASLSRTHGSCWSTAQSVLHWFRVVARNAIGEARVDNERAATVGATSAPAARIAANCGPRETTSRDSTSSNRRIHGAHCS